MSQLKIRLSSVGKIYLVYGILENVKTCLYGNKVADLKQIQSLSRDKNNYRALSKQFPTALWNDTQVAMKKGSEIADSESFLKLWSK